MTPHSAKSPITAAKPNRPELNSLNEKAKQGTKRPAPTQADWKGQSGYAGAPKERRTKSRVRSLQRRPRQVATSRRCRARTPVARRLPDPPRNGCRVRPRQEPAQKPAVKPAGEARRVLPRFRPPRRCRPGQPIAAIPSPRRLRRASLRLNLSVHGLRRCPAAAAVPPTRPQASAASRACRAGCLRKPRRPSSRRSVEERR